MRKSILSVLFFLCVGGAMAQNIHEVQKGETLYALSKKYGIEISSIIKKNPQAEYGLKEGMKILIDESVIRDSEVAVDGEKIKYVEHKIKPFETFYSLKNRYGLDREDILKLNPNLESGFRAGEKIKIPVIEGKTKLKRRNQKIYESVFFTNKKLEEKKVEKVVPLTKEELKEEKEAKKKEKERLKWFSPKSEEYNVSFLLPFYLDDNDNALMSNSKKIYPKSKYAIEYYAGSQIAIDEWNKKGMKVNIHLFDSENDKTTIGKALNSDEIKNSDVLIGPFYTDNVKFASDYLKFKNIDIVAPLSTDAGLVLNHENVYQMNASVRFQLKKTSEYISKKYGTLPVVVIRRDTSTERVLASAFTSQLTKSDNPELFRTITVGMDDLMTIRKDYFVQNQDYVVIIASEDRVFLTNVLTSLNRIRNKNLITFTTPSIIKYNHIDRNYLSNLQVHYPKVGHVDYDNSNVKDFVEAYRLKHGHEPDYKFAFTGYDVTNFVLNQLYTKGKLDPENLTPTNLTKMNFDFYQPEDKFNKFGYINQGVSIFKIEEDNDSKIYPFK